MGHHVLTACPHGRAPASLLIVMLGLSGDQEDGVRRNDEVFLPDGRRPYEEGLHSFQSVSLRANGRDRKKQESIAIG